jgi:hypothetical protein
MPGVSAWLPSEIDQPGLKVVAYWPFPRRFQMTAAQRQIQLEAERMDVAAELTFAQLARAKDIVHRASYSSGQEVILAAVLHALVTNMASQSR